jgi:hypothetical protein
MKKELLGYKYLWEQPDTYILLEPYGSREIYAILESSTFWPIGIEDPRVKSMVIQRLIKAGVKIIGENEYFELRVQSCSNLWEDDKDHYVLVDYKDSDPPRYGIVDVHDGMSLRIENEDIRYEVVERMLKANVRVVTNEECNRLIRES